MSTSTSPTSPPTPMILHGRIAAKPGQREALLAQLLRAASLMDEVVSCRLYLVATASDDPDGVHITELWDSAEAHAASLTMPATRALIAETMPLIAGAPSGSR